MFSKFKTKLSSLFTPSASQASQSAQSAQASQASQSAQSAQASQSAQAAQAAALPKNVSWSFLKKTVEAYVEDTNRFSNPVRNYDPNATLGKRGKNVNLSAEEMSTKTNVQVIEAMIEDVVKHLATKGITEETKIELPDDTVAKFDRNMIKQIFSDLTQGGVTYVGSDAGSGERVAPTVK